MQISFVYADNSGVFHSVPVADYGYAAAGALTYEWDPRLGPRSATIAINGAQQDLPARPQRRLPRDPPCSERPGVTH